MIAPDRVVGQRQRERSQMRQNGEYLVPQVLGAADCASLFNKGEVLRVREWMDGCGVAASAYAVHAGCKP